MKHSRNRSRSLACIIATSIFLVAAVGVQTSASASEKGDQISFVEFIGGGEPLGSQELDQLRGEGLETAPTSSGDAEAGVAVQLWDDLRHGRQTRNATFDSATYGGEATLTVNGVSY